MNGEACCDGFQPWARWRRSPSEYVKRSSVSVITLKSPREIDIMGRAGRIVAETLARIREVLRPGMSTEDLDAEAERFIRSHDGAVPSFKGLYGFPKTLCTSVDEEIVHGIPSPKRVLAEGSIVSVDVGVQLEGLHADSATTLPVGRVAPDTERLLRVTQECLAAGIAEARVGNHVGDIGYAVQRVAENAGYGVVRELVGHGIGTRFHEEPQIPNYGAPKRGPRLLEGMTLAIEPMITVGSPVTRTLADKWTVVTADGSLSAHFEHTIVITANGPRILTSA
jgi:methionyl aminopeptidase